MYFLSSQFNLSTRARPWPGRWASLPLFASEHSAQKWKIGSNPTHKCPAIPITSLRTVSRAGEQTICEIYCEHARIRNATVPACVPNTLESISLALGHKFLDAYYPVVVLACAMHGRGCCTLWTAFGAEAKLLFFMGILQTLALYNALHAHNMSPNIKACAAKRGIKKFFCSVVGLAHA